MKGPAPPRPNKPPSAQKLKLLCSFGGTFAPCHSSGDHRYVGGEARIITLDRRAGVDLSNLLSRVSVLCPGRPFSIHYLPPDAPALLVSIATDDDVRRMIEDHNSLAGNGRIPWLRLFICNASIPRYVLPPRNPVFLSLEKRDLARDFLSDSNSRARLSEARDSRFSPCIGERNEAFICGFGSNRSVGHVRPLGRACNLPLTGYCAKDPSLCKMEHAVVGSRSQVKTCFAPLSFSTQSSSRVLQSKFFCGNSGSSGVSHCRMRNHRPRRHRFSQIGTRDFGVQWVCDGKHCMQKGYRRLRPRSTILKLGQGRSHQSSSAKLINVWDNKGVLRERAKPVSLFRTASFEEDLSCNRNPTEHVTDTQLLWEDNPFSVVTEESLNFATSNGNDCRDFNKVCGIEKSVNTGNVDTMFSNLNSLWGALRNNSEENDMKSADYSTCPESDLTTQLDVFDLYGVKSSLDLSMRNLSLSPAELCQSSPCSPLSIGNALEPVGYASNVISMLPTYETMLQLNKKDSMEDNPLNSGLHCANMIEGSDKNSSNFVSDTSELSLQGRLSQTPSLTMAQVSLESGEDIVYCGKKQETMPSTSIMEKKENVQAPTNIRSHKAGENGCNPLQLYSHLACQELQTIQNSDLEEIRKLGSGTHGIVFYGKWKGSDVAIKRLKPSCFAGGELGEDRMVADFWKEAHLLAQLHHPNVMAFYGVVTDGPASNLATVTEYMVNGSLKQVLQRKDRTIDRRKRLIIAMDAAFGMEYLHEKNVIHFDLKASNFLVNMRDPLRPVCKIGDLGLSKVKQRTLVSGGIRGTIPWMAPELLTGKSSMVTEKIDVYSFGIVMWELLTGEDPYVNMHTEEIIAGILKGNLRPEIPSFCDPAWRSLMERCWSSEPSSRPSFSEIAKELRSIAASINIK